MRQSPSLQTLHLYQLNFNIDTCVHDERGVDARATHLEALVASRCDPAITACRVKQNTLTLISLQIRQRVGLLYSQSTLCAL